MRVAFLVSMVAVALTGAAQSPTSAKKLTADDYAQMNEDMTYWDAQYERYKGIRDRALQLYPARRDTPLRELNISDDEVREVEDIAY
jgi:hypothetical protein